ncbi:MAG TPA: ammonia channel protein, partial [Spirochaetota bacterium]|nr:ammonia channel protein [Spirochaetota bacterium]
IQGQYSGLLFGNPKQFFIQIIGSLTVAIYSLVLTVIIFKVIDLFIGIRVTEKEEAMGLDITQHNERGYTIIE